MYGDWAQYRRRLAKWVDLANGGVQCVFCVGDTCVCDECAEPQEEWLALHFDADRLGAVVDYSSEHWKDTVAAR